MSSLNKLTTEQFINLDNYLKEFVDEDYTNHEKFYSILGETTIEEYLNWLTEIKKSYPWIYDPPQMPTKSTDKQPTIGDEYRKEFAQDYGGYTEMVYLISTTFAYKPDEVMELNVLSYLFWGEYLLRKKITENIE